MFRKKGIPTFILYVYGNSQEGKLFPGREVILTYVHRLGQHDKKAHRETEFITITIKCIKQYGSYHFCYIGAAL